ncbi:hypothetical protein HOU03_gp172 [Caulobacter phage CcrSC]|uniref:Uncharacterized protein n=1 Tax=Caulobacter phage CcrSC TaxID=2283272 RepID=A0A385ED38_9CAUD|nr:hypothetical protein HOU03_gp014 [Caulobacter phage CcrSC]YP_009810726.1 hypothetical protein HOU03_gp172 [Caulobacter phage CcrSC]AXQ69596.1 hypothetical protein CcrSC_gp014 [Caulobacter phage CcrSC]AXQ70096.1 hypothetical protein CcrSC_gp514 [Caulobacter phage CcrSC]
MSARERRALSELLALFHAVNSGHVKGRNPYAFPAVKLANEVLTGDPLDGVSTSPKPWTGIARRTARP